MQTPPAYLLAGLVAVFATSARPDPLSETLETLARYPGESALQASVHVSVRSGEGANEERRSGEVTVSAEHSGEGLRVLYLPKLLDRLQAEAGRRSEEHADIHASEILTELGAGALQEAFNFSGPLGHLIDGASVLERKPASDGELAKIKVRAHPSRADAPPYVKESELLVTLWFAEDGVPMVVVTDSRVKAGRLFINVTNQHRVRRELVRVGDRLVVAKSEGKLSVSGFGQSFTKTVEILIRIDQEAE